MKTEKLIIVFITAIIVTFTSCSYQGNNTDAGKTPAEAEKVSYTCPMHPEVNSDKPGKCPKCGMELIKKEVPTDTTHQMHGDSTKTRQH